MLRKTTLPLIFGLVFLLLIITVTTYSYWDDLTKADTDKTIMLGSGTDLVVEKVEASPPAGKKLIPQGAQKGNDDIDEIKLKYNVNLSKKTISDLFLDVTAKKIMIDDNPDYAYLVNVEINKAQSNINNDIIVVNIRVTLNNPGNESVYQAITGKIVKFELHFAAVQLQG
ncbi:MAG: hypothetical protein M0R05_03765 [Bacilli bacterium]|nr:hypothetical protein [Bacilli bacterium]MDD4077594.1 hypothetical protein [Bacilli bacterium]MDD4388754.1 hypothetical protein [Bacilli bacterium]